MSEQDNIRATGPQPSSKEDIVTRKTDSQVHGQSWRRELEIDKKRQTYLDQRRALLPDIEKGSYPFRNMQLKLNRADIEWLVATHDNGRGPIDWNDENQRERKGLDMRGADLRYLDLTDLPLACLCGSLTRNEWTMATEEQRKMASVQMSKANVSHAKLEGAHLYGAELKETAFYETNLNKASLGWTQLEGANLGNANLKGTDFRGANLEGADLHKANLQGADLSAANLEGANISDIVLTDKSGIGPWLGDIHWGSTNLAVIDWSPVEMLSEENRARQKKTPEGNKKDTAHHLDEYKTATRANRQLAVVLQDQGLSEEASHFAYRSQVCKQRLLFLQLLQQLASGKLHWLIRTPQKSDDYVPLLSGTTWTVVLLFILFLYSFSLPHYLGTVFSWIVGIVFALSICLFLLLSIIYQLFLRLFLLFFLFVVLYLVILYFLFLGLVNTLTNAAWQLDLFLMTLPVLVITTGVWAIRRAPSASILRNQTILSDWIKVWQNSRNIYRARFRPWLLLFTQLQVSYGRYAFALFLNLLAGYGYKPGRSLLWYLLVIFGFATSYYAIRHIPLLPNAFVLSLTSFHGRGFFPGLGCETTLDSPLVVLAAIEAVVGLFIEISFIATFTQRFLGK